MIGRMRPFYQAHWDISKDIKHVWLLICTYYIAWIFQWILSGEGRGKWWDRQYRVWIPQCAAPLDVTVTYARDSFVDSPSVLRPGWHMQETALWIPRGAFCPLEGGPDTLAQTHWHQSYKGDYYVCYTFPSAFTVGNKACQHKQYSYITLIKQSDLNMQLNINISVRC